MKPYRLKHLPTGLYFQPYRWLQGHFSKRGKVYFTEANGLHDAHIKGKYNVLFVLDDRDQVVRMWREEGLKVLQVAEGNF